MREIRTSNDTIKVQCSVNAKYCIVSIKHDDDDSCTQLLLTSYQAKELIAALKAEMPK